LRNGRTATCSAAAAIKMYIGHGGAHHDHSSAGNDCFSPLLAGAAFPDAPDAIAMPAAAAPTELTPLPLTAFTTGPAAPPPHSTGPPQLA
jgi:hypothetical protein